VRHGPLKGEKLLRYGNSARQALIVPLSTGKGDKVTANAAWEFFTLIPFFSRGPAQA
jgi:hypothetical protein